MKSSPILFKPEMVRAILDGTKSQTRRLVEISQGMTVVETAVGLRVVPDGFEGDDELNCADIPLVPKYEVGQRLWVKETYSISDRLDDMKPSEVSAAVSVYYHADKSWRGTPREVGKTRVSIHMTRWASRIKLEVTCVRVERLQEISATDAWAEGVRCDCTSPTPQCAGNIGKYRELTDRINGAGHWDLDPWVWVIDFKVLK